MKPGIDHRDISPSIEIETIDGVTIEIRRSDDPRRAERAARLLADLLATSAPGDNGER